MKKLSLLLISLLFVSLVCIGCVPGIPGTQSFTGKYYPTKKEKEIIRRSENDFEKKERSCRNGKRIILKRGYITVDELQFTFNSLNRKVYYVGYDFGLQSRSRHSTAAHDIINTVAEQDLLPFKAMFFLALEKGNYDEAELIRRGWLHCLKKMLAVCKKNEKATMKINYQIEKLTSVVGLTDPMLTTLRKELMVALKEKNWDDSKKIHDLIVARSKQLTPRSKVVQKKTSDGKTVVIVQQPSEQHVKVEHVPRYGAEDVGRAISLLQGRGGSLTSKEAGTLKMLDILMKR